MTDTAPLVFYDISSPLQPQSYAPNPSKARLALSLKGVPFKTTWIDIIDIPRVRKEFNCPATRKLADGSEYPTLPMLRDQTSNQVIGDSFDIANYLEHTFTDSGDCLFPADSTRFGLDYESPAKDSPFFPPITTNEGSKNEAYAKFNLNVDTTFTANIILYSQFLPLNPDTAEAVKVLFCKRAHRTSWDDFCVQGEKREQLTDSFKMMLTSLAELFMARDGPYLEGMRVTYADLIVGGWLNMLSKLMPADEWKDFRTWHDGVFARLHDDLQGKYFVCK
jgi:glutathione S-transferase